MRAPGESRSGLPLRLTSGGALTTSTPRSAALGNCRTLRLPSLPAVCAAAGRASVISTASKRGRQGEGEVFQAAFHGVYPEAVK